MEFMKSVDTWFLIMAVAVLAAFAAWAVQYLFVGIKTSIERLGEQFEKSLEKLEKLVTELFSHRNNHEIRLVALETKCAWEHRDDFEPPRMSGGRRPYDPPIVPIVTDTHLEGDRNDR
jgi:hypothetical protein